MIYSKPTVRQDSPKQAALAQEPFAEAKDGRLVLPAERDTLCPGRASTSLLGLLPSEDGGQDQAGKVLSVPSAAGVAHFMKHLNS